MEILVCSADESVRKRWQDLLADRSVFHAASIDELRAAAGQKETALVLVHRSLISKDTLRALRADLPAFKFFLLSDRPNEDEGVEFLKLGIVGYSNTYIAYDRLAEAVRIILAGSVWIGQQVMQRLIREASSRPEGATENADSLLEQLTAREREIAVLVARGSSNLEIAYELNISERTVKAHLSSIYVKTDTGSRLNLALLVNRR